MSLRAGFTGRGILSRAVWVAEGPGQASRKHHPWGGDRELREVAAVGEEPPRGVDGGQGLRSRLSSRMSSRAARCVLSR